VKNPSPVIDWEPLRTTDIQLQPGETIADVAMGDTERWMATPAASGDPRDTVPHLAVNRKFRYLNRPDDRHDEAHLPRDAPLARQPRDAAG
jgi:hypothetical protein